MSDTDSLTSALMAAQATPEDDGYRTVAELCKLLGFDNPTQIWKRIRTLNERGEIECKMVQRPNITGRMQAVPGYRLINPT